MKRAAYLLLLFGLVALTALAAPPNPAKYAPPPVQKPALEDVTLIEGRTTRLERAVEALSKKGVKDPFLAEVEIFSKAASFLIKHNEYYRKESAAWTLSVLDRGLLRAGQAGRDESPWEFRPGYTAVRAYRSVIDNSVQPYAVTLPADYGKSSTKKWPVHVVLHGRNAGLTEVEFLYAHSKDEPAPKDLDHVEIDIYGRGNNAYRWAGEMDVTEALDAFLAIEQVRGRGPLIDRSRSLLRGFSMGGAGTWHIGLHRPGQWCVMGPGAGFTTTHGYVAGLPEKLPSYQEACLSIYDAVDYAENAAMIHVVAFSGADDPQRAAAKNIEDILKPLNIPMTLLIAPGVEHNFPAEWKKKAEAEYDKFLAKGKELYPAKVRFVTYTLKYSACDWIEILGLDAHYKKATVEAERIDPLTYKVKTSNVRALDIRLQDLDKTPVSVNIDGQRLRAQPQSVLKEDHLFLERRGKEWRSVLLEKLGTERLRKPEKTAPFIGPIDDAFMSPFLCVVGTGQAWHKDTETYVQANLERFVDEWSKYMRGELQVKKDVDVTPDDIGFKNLILFGDPASNSLIDQSLSGLPLQWTRDKITWNGKEYSAAGHVPVMIYPSPLNPNHYIVLNSGHTFHAEDFKNTNAMLFPRLGDYALLKLGEDEKDPLAVKVVNAGLFDEYWHMQP